MNDNVTNHGCITTTDTANTFTSDLYYTTPNYTYEPIVNIPSVWYALTPLYQNKKGDDDMRYLYEVILVNPKDDDFYVDRVVAKSETSALMFAYGKSNFSNVSKVATKLISVDVPFDDLKTSCRVLMEWKKKESLKKAIEIIKKAVE